MALILKAAGETFTNTSLPILRRDKIANNGTLDILDALDTYSWPSQGAPIAGTSLWQSVIGANTGSFAGTIGWSSGFSMDGTDDIITLPSTFKAGASASRVVIFWVKVGTQVSTTGNGIIAWCGDSSASSQFMCYLDHNTTDASTYITINSGNGVSQVSVTAISTLPVSRVAQIGISMQLEGGVYRYKTFVNGAQVGTFLSALASLPQPTAACRLGGSVSGFTNAFIGTHLRCISDDLSVVTPEAMVAADYAAYSGRFA